MVNPAFWLADVLAIYQFIDCELKSGVNQELNNWWKLQTVNLKSETEKKKQLGGSILISNHSRL